MLIQIADLAMAAEVLAVRTGHCLQLKKESAVPESNPGGRRIKVTLYQLSHEAVVGIG